MFKIINFFYIFPTKKLILLKNHEFKIKKIFFDPKKNSVTV